MSGPLRLRAGERLVLKKPHPCGTNLWEILQPGIDFKLRCTGCGQIVRIPRPKLERRVREVIGPESEEGTGV